METLIVHPRNKEQLKALKAFMKAFKIDFNTTEETGSFYNKEFLEKIRKSEEDVKAGRTTTIDPADILNLG